MDSVVDFGCVVATSQVISKHHPITNQGSAPDVFHVQYSGDAALSFSPCSGVIAAGTTQWLKVKLRTDRARQIDEKAQVILQNRSALVLSIRAEVVNQCLEVFDLQGNPLSCLLFGPVYFGTSCVGKVVLRNDSPQDCDWVCLLQDTVAGTEVGTDLQKSTDTALLERMKKCSPSNHDASQVLVCVPEQGRLCPYGKTTVTVCFSPVYKSTSGRKRRDQSAYRQDYCLFLLFESVKSKHGLTCHNAKSSAELAVTGSGLPVSLVPSPSDKFDFLSCAKGQRVDLLCVLKNLCPQLPVRFQFHKIAHFTTKPAAGTIAPGQCQDVVLSFSARQQGSFKVHQKLDVLGHVLCQRDDDMVDNMPELELCSFHTITLHLSAVCCSETTYPMPKLNPVSSSIGSWPHVKCSELAGCRGIARVAILNAHKTQLHKHRRERSLKTDEEEFLAFPNDRALSIRPASPHRQYRTIFTGIPRYRYVDTSYAFTKEEEEQRQQHQQFYADFIKQLRQTRHRRMKERQQEKVENEVDIGIVPPQGLVPPPLCISDLATYDSCGSPGNKRSCPQNTTSVTHQALEVMNVVPSTSQEVADCKRTLTAQELCQVVIGPLLVDFGDVCVQSVCVQKLELINHLSVYVWVQLEVDFLELQGSSPLSHVLPPHSHITLPLTFQSSKLGPFYRPVSYSVNQRHPGQIVVQAQVVPLYLELSTNLLVLHPTPSLLAASGYRSSVTLRNKCNYATEFTWQPVVTELGILFSVRPAAGVVEPYKELDCEVVWHPSFSSPLEGDFDLCIHQGNTQRLHCIAKVGATSVHLVDKRVVFGPVPLNMPSIRTAVLNNTGQNHAYYQVLDVCPLPGMMVSPSEGTVPSKGQAVLKIHFNPASVVKFDTRIMIALKNMKSIELRVWGSVEAPNIDISVSRFWFHRVYTGSQKAIPFALTNKSPAKAQVTFDLSEYEDFSVQFPQPSAKQIPGLGVVEVKSFQTVDCFLVFSPTQLAGYNFNLPLIVNGKRWPSASQSSLPTLPSSSTSSLMAAGSRKPSAKPCSHSVTLATQQSPCVQAIVLCAPLEISSSYLQFIVEPETDTYTKRIELKAASEESPSWHAITGKCVHWWIDCSATTALTQDRRAAKLCAVSPSSGSLGPGQSICLMVSVRPKAIRTGSVKVTKLSLPLYLGDKRGEGTGGEQRQQPYRELSVTITLQAPSITINPPQILFTPVPLKSSAETTLTLLAVGYPRGTTISAEVDEVEMEDRTKIQPISVTFPEGNTIPPQNHDQEASVTSLLCRVTFCSAVPLSLCKTITFTDDLHNRFKVKLCAIADNCLLTVWPYMALHYSEQQIVLKTGDTAVEAVLQRYHTPSPASGLTSSSSSTFNQNSSTNKSSVSFSDGDSVSRRTSKDTDISLNRETPANLGFPEFPPANTEEGLHHQKVLFAVEMWFSLFGWSSGQNPITVPHTLRRVMPTIQMDHSNGPRAHCVSQNKDSRSVVDMLHHLTGRQIPGIPRYQTFSSDLDQRTNQLLQQHEAMLAFLRVQGACLCHIRPEYLLDALEFKHWCSQQSNEIKYDLNYSSVDYESLSKRSWTDVLLQIYKVLVLCHVSESGPNTTVNHTDVDGIFPVSSQSLASNVYSSRELQLLLWLNIHYQSMREIVWGTGEVPSARWIVNFDLDLTDGLVLAALLAAYCPYLIRSHFQRMYTTTLSLEQILHNNIIVTQALNALCLNINIQPTDLSDPNPVQMLILCVHLYENLPQYRPLHTITLSGGLHSTFNKQVRLKNPSSKPVKYQTFLFGENAHLFSPPDGSKVTLPPKSSTEVNIQFNCSFLQPMEAVLLLISSSAFGLRGNTLAFNLKTHLSHIIPTKTVECKSPCYQPEIIEVPLINTFNKDAKFRVVLLESTLNPLEPETKKDGLFQQASSKATEEKMPSDKICGEEVEVGEGNEFLSTTRRVCLSSGQTDILKIHYLPFFRGTKYCSVLLVCPQVGDMVYLVKATSEVPLPSPLTARPSSNIVSIPKNSGKDMCVSVLHVHSKVGQVCEEVLRVPRINMLWEQALAIWGQHHMKADERRRRTLTNTLHSSTVRMTTATQKLCRQPLLKDVGQSKGVEYNVEVSLPQYFTLPHTVIIPIKEDTKISSENPADCGCVEIPLRFQADTVGQFTCEVILSSWCDTRLYLLEALVTSQGGSTHLDLSSPAHSSVNGYIPLLESTQSGPSELNCYPYTRLAQSQGKLLLHNDCDYTEHVFALRGMGEHPLPVNHVVLRCPIGRTTHTQLDVPNYSQRKVTLKMVTDLFTVTGNTSLEINPGYSAPYTLTVSPWKLGKQTGHVSFVEINDTQDANEGQVFGCYEALFSLEIIGEPAAPIKVIDVQCVTMSSVAIEIPVNSSGEELLMLDVYLEGDSLSGANRVSVPPREALIYKATFSPCKVGKSTGRVVFQSETVEEFWYQLELYALPPPVMTLPQVCCQLGKWTGLTIPLVNPTAETLELVLVNSNPRNYSLEMESGSTLTVEPHSSTQLGVRFSPSAIGEGNHKAEITFFCPQLQEWCVLLSGRGLKPQSEDPLRISSRIGSKASISIPFTNPTELPATLSVTLTDEDPSGAPNCHPVTGKDIFSILLNHTEGIEISERATLDVPVVFAPKSMEVQQAWLRITLKSINNWGKKSNSSMHSMRSEQEVSAICWIYPLCGVPMEVPVDYSPLGVVQCEAGCQLEKKVDVLLTGCEPGNRDQKAQEVTRVMMEDFQCAVRSDSEVERSEVEDCLTPSIVAARRDPENGIITLTLNLVYTPLNASRSSGVLAVQAPSGQVWEFPIILIAVEPQVDDVILTEPTVFGKTSAVGFRLTSTSRRHEQFTAAFLPGSSSEFTVTPVSGMLPPAGSTGALVIVSFMPTKACNRHRARLAVQAGDKRWTYEIRGKTPEDLLPLCNTSVEDHSFVQKPPEEQQQLPFLANSSPLKHHR